METLIKFAALTNRLLPDVDYAPATSVLFKVTLSHLSQKVRPSIKV